MNAKARALGMRSTRYVEPTGLSRANVASPEDLAKLVLAVERHPLSTALFHGPAFFDPAGARPHRLPQHQPAHCESGLEDPPAKDRLHRRGGPMHDPACGCQRPADDHGVPRRARKIFTGCRCEQRPFLAVQAQSVGPALSWKGSRPAAHFKRTPRIALPITISNLVSCTDMPNPIVSRPSNPFARAAAAMLIALLAVVTAAAAPAPVPVTRRARRRIRPR